MEKGRCFNQRARAHSYARSFLLFLSRLLSSPPEPLQIPIHPHQTHGFHLFFLSPPLDLSYDHADALSLRRIQRSRSSLATILRVSHHLHRPTSGVRCQLSLPHPTRLQLLALAVAWRNGRGMDAKGWERSLGRLDRFEMGRVRRGDPRRPVWGCGDLSGSGRW